MPQTRLISVAFVRLAQFDLRRLIKFMFDSDSAAGRTLIIGMGYTAPLTPAKCLDACHAQGYLYAGMEYSAVRLPVRPCRFRHMGHPLLTVFFSPIGMLSVLIYVGIRCDGGY